MITLRQAMDEVRNELGPAKRSDGPWEKLDARDEEEGGLTYRMKVPGGYLYRYGTQGYCYTPVMVFVPAEK